MNPNLLLTGRVIQDWYTYQASRGVQSPMVFAPNFSSGMSGAGLTALGVGFAAVLFSLALATIFAGEPLHLIFGPPDRRNPLEFPNVHFVPTSSGFEIRRKPGGTYLGTIHEDIDSTCPYRVEFADGGHIGCRQFLASAQREASAYARRI